jgi:hypothetical protein
MSWLVKREGQRVRPVDFNNVPHTLVEISHGRSMDAENQWLAENTTKMWARTRFEHHVIYMFENDTEALHFKMRFG